jgi:hypothetical protein
VQDQTFKIGGRERLPILSASGDLGYAVYETKSFRRDALHNAGCQAIAGAHRYAEFVQISPSAPDFLGKRSSLL